MKFSELWLREFLSLNFKTKEICNQLTKIGFEVENIFKNKIKFKNIIVGKIMFYYFNVIHNIFIYVVNVGNNEYLESESFKKKQNMGMNIAVLRKKILKFDVLFFRNIKNINKFSKVKFCSYKNLNLFDYSDNIVILPENSILGSSISKYFLQDKLIKINIPTNRIHSLGIVGIAKELYAFNNIKYKLFLNCKNTFLSYSDNIKLFVCSYKKSFKYVGRIIKGINLNIPTPFWIKEKLRCCNILSVNILEDIINFIYIETGQIFHIFDTNSINNNIYIRLSKNKEEFISKDDNIYILKKPYWVIADDYKIFSLGSNGLSKFSTINVHTDSIFLGSANIYTITNYKPKFFNNILKLNKFYFSKTIDYSLQEYIINYATKMLIEICGGNVTNLIYNNEYCKKKIFSKEIKLYIKNIYLITGIYISKKNIFKILQNLDYKIFDMGDFLLVFPPDSRLDVKIEEDIINDIIRIYDINKISSKPFSYICKINKENYIKNFLYKIKNILILKGYSEVINYSFIDSDTQNLLFPKKDFFFLNNPISLDYAVLRTSLINGLIKNLCYNKNRQQETIKLFEIGLCFIPDTVSYLGIKQVLLFSGIIYGNRNDRHWDFTNKKLDFYDLKGDLESVFEIFKENYSVEFTYLHKKIPFLHPGKSAGILISGVHKGYIGTLNPILQEKLNLNSVVNIFEIVLDLNFPPKKKKYLPISNFPISKRDIVIIVSKKILSLEVIKICKETTKENIIDVCIFDVYQGRSIMYGKKSLAIGLKFQNKFYTLKEHEIIFFVEKCIFALKKQFRAILRDS